MYVAPEQVLIYKPKYFVSQLLYVLNTILFTEMSSNRLIKKLLDIYIYIYFDVHLDIQTDSQLKCTTSTSCLYTVYLLMMGYKYARNMQRLIDEIN